MFRFVLLVGLSFSSSAFSKVFDPANCLSLCEAGNSICVSVGYRGQPAFWHLKDIFSSAQNSTFKKLSSCQRSMSFNAHHLQDYGLNCDEKGEPPTADPHIHSSFSDSYNAELSSASAGNIAYRKVTFDAPLAPSVSLTFQGQPWQGGGGLVRYLGRISSGDFVVATTGTCFVMDM